MMEISILLIVLYVPLWLGTLTFILTKSKKVSRVFQSFHCLYFLVFSTSYYFHGTSDLPNQFLLITHLITAFYFTYRFVLIIQEEQQEKDPTKDSLELKETVEMIFPNDKSNSLNP